MFDHASATQRARIVPVYQRTAVVDGHRVFYREAGNASKPTIVLLHGFPTSSHMFRNLINDLSDEYHLVAPDHIGFGFSDMPKVDEFEYSFENLTTITLGLLDQLGLNKFALYLMDYGAPIGLRIASRNPERVTALLVQSGNAYMEGFTPFWDRLFAHAEDRPAHEASVREYLEPKATRWQYTHGVPADRLERLSAETWTLDQRLLERAGNKEIQLQLFWDYQFNIPGYPSFQEYFRRFQPPTLITWGKNDEIFGAPGATAFSRDLPNAEVHLLDGGHFALETHGDEIASLIRDFLDRNIGQPRHDS
jgi:pimeloyl-ACP methyl ester carboxylesterase